MNVNDTDIVRVCYWKRACKKRTRNRGRSVAHQRAPFEGAEAKVWNRLRQNRGRFLQRRKVVGVPGCMAERLKEDLFQDGC
jgi:hypothetical protein